MIAILMVFLMLAGIGFVASLAVHLLALFGVLPPGGEAVFGLHAGVFVVGFPVLLVSFRIGQGQRTNVSWKQMLSGCPAWMRYAALGLLLYAIVNLVIAFSSTTNGHASGSEALNPATLRVFSGHWMFFYGLAFAVIFSAYRKPWLLRTAKCPIGHKVAHAEGFFATCGAALQSRG